jgi:hypothetical protein
VAYLVAGERDEPAAATARTFIEGGLLGEDWIFGADGCAAPARDEAEALEQIVDSAAARDHGGEGLERFMGQVDRALLGHCVLFTPAVDGPWVARVVAFARALPAPATVIMAVDAHLDERRERGLLARLLWQPERAVDKTLRRLPALHAALRAAGAEVRLLHRPTGQVISEPQLKALAALGPA